MPKIVDFDKKKEEIMQESIKVFVQKGYYDTKLSDIADRCGMGRTTLYQYFKNKDEIFEFAIRNISGMLENDCKEIAENSSLPVIEKIKMMVGMLTQQTDKEKNMIVMLIDLWLRLKRENNIMAGRLNEHVVGLRQIFRQLLEEGVAKKQIRQINIQSMAFALYALVESFVLQASFSGNITFEEHLKSINILIDGLKA